MNVYSLTESGGTLIVSNPIGSPRPELNGQPWGWCEVSIRGDGDEELSAGETGEICLRPTVPWTFMTGYFKSPDRTLECLRNLWLHTGDMGHLTEDGYLVFTGRQAHWMRIRGENVSAYEIEGVISQYPGIDEAIVVGVPSQMGEEEAKLFVILADGAEFDPVALVTWCEERLAPFKVPRFVEVIDEFPRSSAKREVERHKLRERSNEGAWDGGQRRSRKGASPSS